MAEMIRVNIGKEPKYLPAAGGKKQVAYVDVVENRRKFDSDTKQWVDAEPRWYEARFDGHDADVIRDQFQTGDSLVVFGEVERHVRETADGKTYRTTKLYVEGFGPDPRFTRFAIDRSPRQAQSAAPTQRVDQSVDNAVDTEADLEVSELQSFRAEVKARLEESTLQLYITQPMANAVMAQVDTDQGMPDVLLMNVDTMLGQMGVQPEVKSYLLSPVQAYAGRHTPPPAPVSPVGPDWPGASPWEPSHPSHHGAGSGYVHAPGL